MRKAGLLAVFGFFLILPAANAFAQGAYPIAGLTPDRRPENAPFIKEFKRNKEDENRFFYGVKRPVPASAMMKSQGAWYTPFGRAGATPPYDIRGWHSSKGGWR